jgi:hypothetical protein
MTYRLKIINKVAYVTRNGFVHAVVDVMTPRMFLCNRQVQVRATNIDELRAVVHGLPSYDYRLDLEIAKDSNGDVARRVVTLVVGKGQAAISTVGLDLIAFSDRLSRLFGKIEDLVRLGETICCEPNSYRPGLSGQVEFYQCDTAGIGTTSVEEWIMTRKRLAIHTNIGKRRVAVAFANSRDPYGLCAPHDELRKEYFVLDSDSTTWIAFRDLPPVTEEVMRTSIKAGLHAPAKVERNQVQLPLKQLFSDADGSNVIAFRRPEVAHDDVS